MEIRFIGEGRRFRTFVDIGSNDGAYGAYIQKLFDIPRVIAFEPLPLYADTLRERGFELHAGITTRRRKLTAPMAGRNSGW